MVQAAPGKISIAADGWTAERLKKGFLSMTAHWVKVEKQIKTVEGNKVVRYHWSLQSAIVGFRTISGTHSGENLEQYMVGVMDQVAIMGQNFSKVSIWKFLMPHMVNEAVLIRSTSCSVQPSTTHQATRHHVRPLRPSTIAAS